MNNNVKLTVVSRVVERADGKETLIGYLVLSNGVAPSILSKQALKEVAAESSFTNAQYNRTFDTLEGTNGASLTNYPAINKDCVLCSPNGIIVYSLVADKATNNIAGVVAFNGIGQCFKLSMPTFMDLANKYNNCNFTVKENSGVIRPVMKDGTEFPIITMELPPKVASKQLHKGNSVTQENKNEVPHLTVTTFIDESMKQFDIPAQQKMTQAMLGMKYLTPYYHCCISAVKRLPAPGLGTFAVTEDTMFYDMKFVAELAIEELSFVMIHEMMHIAMQHSVRFGKTRTSHKLWNIACDLYINSIICDNFGLKFGGPPVTIKVESGDRNKSSWAVSIKTPDFGVYMETIGEKIDLAKDTPETIYDKLIKENPQMASGGSGGGMPSPNQNNGQGQGQNQSQSGQGQQPNQGQGQQGQGQPSQSQGQQGQGSSSKSQSGNPSNGMQDVSEKINNNKTSGQTGMDNLTDGNNASGSELVEVNVVYNGKRLSGKVAMDVMSNNSNKTAESAEESRKQSRAALQRIATKVKMTEQEQGKSLEKHAGLAGEMVSRHIEVGLSDGIRWQELLKSLLKDKPKKTFTLANPNTDYMSLGMTLADRRPIGKPTHLAGVVFAIDVSGSVTDKELNYTLSEVANIFRFYKVDAELIYWSTMVGSAGMFSSLKDMLKINPTSTGGTDVRCVFDYLSGKTRVNGKAEQTKLKDIKAIFILTDGMFSMNFDDYANIGRKVVWLVTTNPITFSPPFGRVIGFKLP